MLPREWNLISLAGQSLLALAIVEHMSFTCPSQQFSIGTTQPLFKFLAIKLGQQCSRKKGGCLFNLELSEIGVFLDISLYWWADFVYLGLPFSFKKRGLVFFSHS